MATHGILGNRKYLTDKQAATAVYLLKEEGLLKIEVARRFGISSDILNSWIEDFEKRRSNHELERRIEETRA